MNVDEPGRHIPARGIDGTRGLRAAQGAHRDDAAISDADVRAEPRVTRAVEDAAAGDEQVEGACVLG